MQGMQTTELADFESRAEVESFKKSQDEQVICTVRYFSSQRTTGKKFLKFPFLPVKSVTGK